MRWSKVVTTPRLLTIISGLLLILAFPLFNIETAAWFCIVPLLITVTKETPRNSFLSGYLCGIIWNTGIFHWMYIYHPLALPLTVFILSFYPAFFCLGINKFCRGSLPGRGSQTRNTGHRKCRPCEQDIIKLPLRTMAAAPLLWTSLEYIRSLGFLGFPWPSLGYSQSSFLPIIQIAEFTGVFGVSFLIVFVNSGIALACQSLHNPGRAFKIIAFTALVPTLCISAGSIIIKQEVQPEEKHLRVALVQGNVNTDRSSQKNSSQVMEHLTALSLQTQTAKPDLIIWPESSVPGDLKTAFATDSHIKRKIEQVVKKTGAYLLTGCPHTLNGRDYNSAFLISPSCNLLGRYDKIHLVPAGEYFPFWRHKKFTRHLLRDAGEFMPGDNYTVFEIPGKGKFSVLICFEGIFGDLTRRFSREGAEFLVNITNDVWSNSKTSHYQHASIATFRAIENRRYFVRAGNSGISRIINPYGRIEKNLDYAESGILVTDISLRSGTTFYARYGDTFSKLALAITCLIFLTKFIYGKRGLQRC